MNEEDIVSKWQLDKLEDAFRRQPYDRESRPGTSPVAVCASVVLSVSMFSCIMVFWIR